MKKVLIADDYPDMRELLGRQIEIWDSFQFWRKTVRKF
jgi:hypothetical protein